MRRIAIILVLGALVIAGGRWYASRDDGPFKLPEPKPTTIAALGRVKRPPMHDCTASLWGKCFDYVNVWCQAPCATYRVRGVVVSIKRLHDRAYGGYLLVLRDGDATIAGRIGMLGRVRVGDRVRASGVLFFPTPRGRDGDHTPNGAELSPVLDLRRG